MRLLKESFFALACWTVFHASPALAAEGQLNLPITTSDRVGFVLGERSNDLSPQAVLQVYVGASSLCCDDKTPISGAYNFEEGVVTFEPSFEFLEGQPYTVKTPGGEMTEFVIAPAETPNPPEILAIYPSGNMIPENTLRFYIQFSAPMAPHLSEKFIALVGADGTPDPEAFMSFKQELWNADRTRLTLLMDPGRIKRGVAQNVRLGPALIETESYALKIKAGWPSARGPQSASGFEKTFIVTPPLRARPTVDTWDVALPGRGTLDPISVTFDRSFDRFQTMRSISVKLPDGTPVEGEAMLETSETVWRFFPDKAWDATALELVVDTRLEDVAGNNFRETLDHVVGTDTFLPAHIVIPLVVDDP
ncbi:MAG: hypothetical protein AAGA22_07260 [Pseudomonadota bacterium]